MNYQNNEVTIEYSGLARETGYATGACALAVLVGMVAERTVQFDDLSLIFITAVIFVSTRSRMSVAVYSAILCFLFYNYFFIHPRYSFLITASKGMVTVGTFLVAALICGRLANKLRTQIILLRSANAQASALKTFGQRLTSAADESEAMRAAKNALRDALEAEVVMFSVDELSGEIHEQRDEPANTRFDPSLQSSALACLHAKQDGRTNEMRDLSWHCQAVSLHSRNLGIACFRQTTAMPQIPQGKAQMVDAMLRDLAQALARARLVRQLEDARVQAESERLRAALLSSVSHDLRSPLSTIIGSAESLSAYRDNLTTEDQLALARDIHSEGQRLDRYIQNLLDMTRVGHGALAITREWIGLDEIFGAVLARMRKFHPSATVNLDSPSPVPLLYVHSALIEQALFNVLDNAVKFSPFDEPVTIRASWTQDQIKIDICDLGIGIPESDRTMIFDRFHTSGRSNRSGGGTGLGLTICQGIVTAHKGTVVALPGEHGIGTIIRITLPLEAMPTDSIREE
ncbi:ATP-binding protein [Arenimonas sp. GDDSR-1]|uniref:ATP-binding protein n=1 Tax=Arenimonas sp. GDDSR-1 TaxID=2950125 RepID=UPI00262B46B3|nr:ATP-binding protein [Arenimonas sp. GDDSR-1]